MKRTSLVLSLLLVAAPLAAQEDDAAGLFTKARQLPMVSQSVTVWIDGGEARLELTQVFFNNGSELAQADYRLHLPREAVVTGFGFWRDGRFLAAELKEREEARAEHAAAAHSGRPTALMQHEGTIHSFSVYPVPAGAQQEVTTTISLPVVTERGRSSLRLPLDSFLGHARLASTVLVHATTREPLRALDVTGAKAVAARREARTAEIAFSSDHPVEVWWATEAPPLLTEAEGVELDDGSYALQVRLALNQTPPDLARPTEIVLLIDASPSMRRRGRTLARFVGRVLDQAPAPVRVVAVADTAVDVTGSDRHEILRRLLGGEAGYTTTWEGITAAAASSGCGDPAVRCVAVTDPQVLDLPAERRLDAVFLADADELAYFGNTLGPSAPVYEPDVDAVAEVDALADQLVLPVLELRSIRQGGEELLSTDAGRRVAQGGMLRVLAASHSAGPLRLSLAVAGHELEREVEVQLLDAAGRLGHAVRRAFYRQQLESWTAEYRRLRDPELKRQIVEVSLREGIPTDLTALQVAAPETVLPRTGTPAPVLRAAGLVLLVLGLLPFLLARREQP